MHRKSCVSHLKNTGSLNYEDLLNVDAYHYIITKKPSFLNIIIGFIRKVFIFWEAVSLLVADTSFPNF